MKKILLIIGGKSTGIEIRELVDDYYANNFDEIYNVTADPDCKYSFIIDKEIDFLINNKDVDLYYIISMSNHKLRNKFILNFYNKKIKPFNVIHPNAIISKSASLGLGIYVGSGVVISSFAKIGNHTLLNHGVLIGHDANVGENCVFNPKCQISGNVSVEDNVLVGSGTFIKQGKKIGKDTLLDAMCFINKDIGSNKMCTNKSELKQFKNIFNERKTRKNN